MNEIAGMIDPRTELRRIENFCRDRATRFPITEVVCGRIADDIANAIESLSRPAPLGKEIEGLLARARPHIGWCDHNGIDDGVQCSVHGVARELAAALRSMSKPAPLPDGIADALKTVNEYLRNTEEWDLPDGWQARPEPSQDAMKLIASHLTALTAENARLKQTCDLEHDSYAIEAMKQRVAELTRERDDATIKHGLVVEAHKITMADLIKCERERAELAAANDLAGNQIMRMDDRLDEVVAERDSLKQSAQELAAELGRQSTARGEAEEQLETIEARTIKREHDSIIACIRSMAWPATAEIVQWLQHRRERRIRALNTKEKSDGE